MFKHSYGEKLSSCLKIIVISLIVASLNLSCEKSEGMGGSGSIAGTLTEKFYNDDFSMTIHEEPAVDEEIYIVYGSKKELGNRIRTNHLGQFRFKYLYPGTYQVYFNSADSTTPLDLDAVRLYELELGKGEDYEFGELEKLSTLDFDDGAAVIKGKVKVIQYVATSSWPNLVIEKTYYATEKEIYLTYGNHSFYDERVHTQAEGVFEFGGLIPGEYLVFLHYDDVSGESDKKTWERKVTIEGLNQVIDLGEIVIEKL